MNGMQQSEAKQEGTVQAVQIVEKEEAKEMQKRPDLKDMTRQELREFIKELGQPAFRGDQIFSWMYGSATEVSQMKNLPKQLQQLLSERSFLTYHKIERVQRSKSDGTRKYLFRLADANTVESVFMKYKFGNSICVSTQAGCRMGCRFCASGIQGLARSLSAAEIAEQVLAVQRDTKERISHIVLMGTGEPFDNYDNVAKFLRLVHDEKGLNLSLRNITVSTCGLIPQIRRFAQEFPQVNLAVSLHAASDEVRNQLMPINKTYPIAPLLAACREHAKETGRRTTFEYTLVRGINDSQAHLKQLSGLLSGMNCHVNLIPMNPVSEKSYRGTDRRFAAEFCKGLSDRGIPATVRRELGSDIDAACGQLRLNAQK